MLRTLTLTYSIKTFENFFFSFCVVFIFLDKMQMWKIKVWTWLLNEEMAKKKGLTEENEWTMNCKYRNDCNLYTY